MNKEELQQIEADDKKLPYTKDLDKYLHYVSDRVTELRLNEDISERSLGLDIGRGESYIRHVTSGKIRPSLVALFQLCERFSIEPKEFFDADVHNPLLFREVMEAVKGLNDDEIKLVLELINKLKK